MSSQQQQLSSLALKNDTMRKRRRRVKKAVSFAEDAFLYPGGWTEDDVVQSWISRDELAQFKNERKDVVRALKRAGFDASAIDQDRFCLRGFEPYFSVEINKATKYNRDLFYSMVFSEQERQRTLTGGTSLYDDEAMREVSIKASAWNRDNARELAVLDALECFAFEHPELAAMLKAQQQQQSSSQRTPMDTVVEEPVVQSVGVSEPVTEPVVDSSAELLEQRQRLENLKLQTQKAVDNMTTTTETVVEKVASSSHSIGSKSNPEKEGHRNDNVPSIVGAFSVSNRVS